MPAFLGIAAEEPAASLSPGFLREAQLSNILPGASAAHRMLLRESVLTRRLELLCWALGPAWVFAGSTFAQDPALHLCISAPLRIIALSLSLPCTGAPCKAMLTLLGFRIPESLS